MTINLGGVYKTFLIGGPKNGRVCYTSLKMPKSFVYNVASVPRLSAVTSIGPNAFGLSLDDTFKFKQVTYNPMRFSWPNHASCQWQDYLVMVYSRARDITENRTLERLVRSGRIKPFAITNFEDYPKV